MKIVFLFKLLTDEFSLSGDFDIILGDVYVTGQLQDVFCRSGVTINESAFYLLKRPDKYQSLSKSCYHVIKKTPAIDARYDGACDLEAVPKLPTYLICEDV